MNPLHDLDADELVTLSDQDFQGKIRKHARAKTVDAMNAIEEVMTSSDDDQARLLAATKILKIAKAEEEERLQGLSFGISEEVFRIALAGLGNLALLAGGTSPQPILRDVTPAKADPRPVLPDLSPLSRNPALESQELTDEPQEIEDLGDIIEVPEEDQDE